MSYFFFYSDQPTAAEISHNWPTYAKSLLTITWTIKTTEKFCSKEISFFKGITFTLYCYNHAKY